MRVIPTTATIGLDGLPELFARTTAFDINACSLTMAPLQNALIKAVGCHRAIGLSGFKHMSIALRQGAQTLAHIHALGANRAGQPSEIGQKGTMVRIVLLTPSANDSRIRAAGHTVQRLASFAAPDSELRRDIQAEAIRQLDKALVRERIPYVVPGLSVIEKFIEELGDRSAYDQLSALQRFSVEVRRQTLGHALCAMPQPVFNIAATLGSPFLISDSRGGTNSNATFNTIASRILELPVAGLISPKEAPMIDCSVDDLIAEKERLRAWRRTPNIATRPQRATGLANRNLSLA